MRKTSVPLSRFTLQDHLHISLHERIGGGSRGFRLPAEKELAEEFGVSVPTLRKALGKLAGEGVLTTSDGKGWCVTDRAMDRRVALLCDLDLTTIGSSPQPMLKRIQGCRRLLEQAGYGVNIYLGDAESVERAPEKLTSKQFLKDMETRGFAGVIAIWAYPDQEWTDRLKELNIPMVGFGMLHEHRVAYDVESYVRPALKLLKKRGVNRVAFLDSVSQWRIGEHDKKRLRDVRQWIDESGLETRESWIRQDWHPSVDGAGWSSFRELWTSDRVRPEAVMLSGPRLWSSVEQAVRSLKIRIPEELQIVITGDLSATPRPYPIPTTQFLFDTAVLAREAVDILLGLMSGRKMESTRRMVSAWSVWEPDPSLIREEEISSVSMTDHNNLLNELYL